MKFKQLIFLIPLLILFASCSSLPKKERLAAVNEKKEQSALFLGRGHNEYGWNNFESSISLYKSSFSLAATVDWEEGMIRSLVHMSRSADRINDSESSLEYLRGAEVLLQETEIRNLKILVGNRKSEWLLFNESPQKALEQSDTVISMLGSEKSEEAGESWRIRAAAYKKLRKYDDALDSIEKALSLDKGQSYIAELASDYYIRASIYSLSGREEDAVDSMLKALKKDKYIENTPAIAQDLYALALIYEKNGQKENANHYFQRTYLVYKGEGRVDIPPVLIEKLQKQAEDSFQLQEIDAF